MAAVGACVFRVHSESMVIMRRDRSQLQTSEFSYVLVLKCSQVEACFADIFRYGGVHTVILLAG